MNKNSLLKDFFRAGGNINFHEYTSGELLATSDSFDEFKKQIEFFVEQDELLECPDFRYLIEFKMDGMRDFDMENELFELSGINNGNTAVRMLQMIE